LENSFAAANISSTLLSYHKSLCHLYENRNFPFNTNLLRNHVFVGAIHELPCPVTTYLQFSSFVVPAPGMAVCMIFNSRAVFTRSSLRYVAMRIDFERCPAQFMGGGHFQG
jgi:hypothetical protein